MLLTIGVGCHPAVATEAAMEVAGAGVTCNVGNLLDADFHAAQVAGRQFHAKVQYHLFVGDVFFRQALGS